MLRRLDPALHPRLRDLIQVFVHEKHWEGCGGLELTDEHRVVTAAQACVLLVGVNNHDLFAEAVSILVYPSTVIIPRRTQGVFELYAPTVRRRHPRIAPSQPRPYGER